jgi:hypothetical protein
MSRRLAVRTLTSLGVLLLALGFGNLAGLAAADTEGVPVTVTASVTGTSQTNVPAPGPLTGLADGDEVVLTATGNPAPFFGFDVRICKPSSEVEVVQQSDFSPTSGGNCLAAPFEGGATDDQFKSVSASPGNTTATVAFRVGTGSQPDAAGLGTTIECGVGHPCALWLKLQVPATFNGGNAWVHVDLAYGSDVVTTTTTSTTGVTTTTVAGTTTTTVAGTTTTRATTTTTAVGSTSTSSSTTTTAATGAATSTTTGPLTVNPSSLAAGGTLNVTTTGWKADSTMTASLNSDPVALGTLTADSAGKATKALIVPASVAAGTHTLKLAGTGTDNAARELTAQVTVTAPGAPLARTGTSVWHLLWNSAALLAAGSLLMVVAVRRGRATA